MKHQAALIALLIGLATAAPAVADDNLNFKNYGNWGSPEFAAQFTQTTYAGHLTDPVKVPTKGTAVYTGSVVGGVSHSFSGPTNYFSYQNALAGAVNVDVNFAARTANTTFSNLTEKSIGSVGLGSTLSMNGVATPTVTVPGTIVANTLGGASSSNTTTGGEFQGVNGKFYGPNAAAVAGTMFKSVYTSAAPGFYNYQSTYVNGTFAASKH